VAAPRESRGRKESSATKLARFGNPLKLVWRRVEDQHRRAVEEVEAELS